MLVTIEFHDFVDKIVRSELSKFTELATHTTESLLRGLLAKTAGDLFELAFAHDWVFLERVYTQALLSSWPDTKRHRSKT